jgi:hypothetical protein
MPPPLRLSATCLCLAVVGCDAATAPVNTTTGAAETSTAAPVTTAAVENPRPLKLAEALAIADLSQLKLPADATRTEAVPFSYSYSAPVSAERNTAKSLAELTAQLTAAGWTEAADPASQIFDKGAIAYFQKQDLWLIASMGESRGFSLTEPGKEVGPDLNVIAMVIGNVDPRPLPRPETLEVQSEEPSSVSYTTATELLAVRKFYQTELPKLGWRECKWQPLAGIEIPMEDKEREQHFFQNSVRLDLNLQRSDEGTRVFMRPSLIKNDLPLPADADEIELGDSPDYMFCETKKPLAGSVAFMKREMELRGWKITDLPRNPEKKIAAAFSLKQEGHDDLRCDFLEAERYVMMQLSVDR